MSSNLSQDSHDLQPGGLVVLLLSFVFVCEDAEQRSSRDPLLWHQPCTKATQRTVGLVPAQRGRQ